MCSYSPIHDPTKLSHSISLSIPHHYRLYPPRKSIYSILFSYTMSLHVYYVDPPSCTQPFHSLIHPSDPVSYVPSDPVPDVPFDPVPDVPFDPASYVHCDPVPDVPFDPVPDVHCDPVPDVHCDPVSDVWILLSSDPRQPIVNKYSRPIFVQSTHEITENGVPCWCIYIEFDYMLTRHQAIAAVGLYPHNPGYTIKSLPVGSSSRQCALNTIQNHFKFSAVVKLLTALKHQPLHP